MVLPGKSNLATAQAAEMPNTVLSGTAIAATSSDRRRAAKESESVSLSQKTPRPWAKASWNTTNSGITRNSATNEIATAPSKSLSANGSSVGLTNLRLADL